MGQGPDLSGGQSGSFVHGSGDAAGEFEATSNYQDVQDPAVTVLVKLREEDAYLAIWTTTPWTLPSNLAVCVGSDIDYQLVQDGDRRIYFAKERVSYYLGDEAQVVKEVKGAELVGLSYEPIFSYFADQRDSGAFVVVSDDYVSTDSGTGLRIKHRRLVKMIIAC